MPNLSSEYFLFSAQESDLALFSGDFSRSEKTSETEQPLIPGERNQVVGSGKSFGYQIIVNVFTNQILKNKKLTYMILADQKRCLSLQCVLR